jgi:cobalt/nickel transport system permease protein
MHMTDALLSVTVGGAMIAASTGSIGYSIKKINKVNFDDKKIPMMGVMGAFIFASQMINFTIPFTGSSGHIGGGILLAALLGPFPALITMASVLLIQALFFADGGLLALGCNIFNIGVIPCLIIYPMIYRTIISKGITPKKITFASILSVVISLQLGAFAVVLETVTSGITELPFLAFVSFMQPIHLAIGFVEGVITAAVLCYIAVVRKDILESTAVSSSLDHKSLKKVVITFLIVTVLVGGVFSIYASSHPDGLEWSILSVAGKEQVNTESQISATTENIQDKTAILPDYNYKGEEHSNTNIGTSLSGIIGGLLTLIIVILAGSILHAAKRKYKMK